MKAHSLLFAILLGALPFAAQTQTNDTADAVPETPATPEPAQEAEPLVSAARSLTSTNVIEIQSDHGELRTETNFTAIYTGNVVATYGDARLTCDVLLIQSDKTAERPDSMIADRNVVIDHKDKEGNPIHATGDRAVYTLSVENGVTNEVIVLSGDARVESKSGLVTGDEMTWNLTTGVVKGSRQRTVIRIKDNSELPFGGSRTNTP